MSEALARFQTNEGKTYQIYPEIANEKVHFTNRFGITIVGDIFYPSTFSADKKYPAIVVSHPHGGVKEQSGGLYAQEMATKGYVTLAIDLSYNGESGGTATSYFDPRRICRGYHRRDRLYWYQKFCRSGAHRTDRHLRQRRFCRQRSLLRPTHQSRCDYQHV